MPAAEQFMWCAAVANLPRVQEGDTFRFIFRDQPPAGILIFESDADASVG